MKKNRKKASASNQPAQSRSHSTSRPRGLYPTIANVDHLREAMYDARAGLLEAGELLRNHLKEALDSERLETDRFGSGETREDEQHRVHLEKAISILGKGVCEATCRFLMKLERNSRLQCNAYFWSGYNSVHRRLIATGQRRVMLQQSEREADIVKEFQHPYDNVRCGAGKGFRGGELQEYNICACASWFHRALVPEGSFNPKARDPSQFAPGGTHEWISGSKIKFRPIGHDRLEKLLCLAVVRGGGGAFRPFYWERGVGYVTLPEDPRANQGWGPALAQELNAFGRFVAAPPWPFSAIAGKPEDQHLRELLYSVWLTSCFAEIAPVQGSKWFSELLTGLQTRNAQALMGRIRESAFSNGDFYRPRFRVWYTLAVEDTLDILKDSASLGSAMVLCSHVLDPCIIHMLTPWVSKMYLTIRHYEDAVREMHANWEHAVIHGLRMSSRHVIDLVRPMVEHWAIPIGEIEPDSPVRTADADVAGEVAGTPKPHDGPLATVASWRQAGQETLAILPFPELHRMAAAHMLLWSMRENVGDLPFASPESSKLNQFLGGCWEAAVDGAILHLARLISPRKAERFREFGQKFAALTVLKGKDRLRFSGELCHKRVCWDNHELVWFGRAVVAAFACWMLSGDPQQEVRVFLEADGPDELAMFQVSGHHLAETSYDSPADLLRQGLRQDLREFSRDGKLKDPRGALLHLCVDQLPSGQELHLPGVDGSQSVSFKFKPAGMMQD